ncbi:MAG: hypothetical protein KY464_14010 [Gemmatimonadetes bacterium]|nr:hypothetical protein [Gemmatimonadota bacterium]
MKSSRIRTAVLLLLFAACSGDGGTGPGGGETVGGGTGGGGTGGGGTGGGGATANRVTVGALTFTARDITVPVGTKVTWVSESAIPHTITPENPGQAGAWEAKEFAATGTVLEHTFTTPGQVYKYRCVFHSPNFNAGMVGTVTVQ